MAQVLIRNLDDEVVAALKRKAELQGRSLEQMLRETLTSAVGFRPAERSQIARRIRDMTPRAATSSDSVDLLREDRARDEARR